MLLTSALLALPEYTPNELLFKSSVELQVKGAKTGVSAFDDYLAQYGVKSINAMSGMPGNRYFKVK
jgi:hypothetical protein